MNSADLFNDINFLIGTTDTNYSSTDKYRNLNRWYKKIFSEVLRGMNEWGFQETWGSATLSANVQQYYFPSDLLTIKRVEVKYEPTATTDVWAVATPVDLNEIGNAITLSADINGMFPPSTPYYDVKDYAGSSFIELYPVPFSAVTGGLKYWYNTNLTELSASANSPVIAEPYHRILSLGAAYDWAGSRQMANAAWLKNEINELMQQCVNYYNNRQMNRQHSILRPEIDVE